MLSGPVKRLQRKLIGKSDKKQEADVDKILSDFASSAYVHGFAAHTVMGRWDSAVAGTWFFAGNGVAAVVEEGMRMAVARYKRRQKRQRRGDG